jgi:hypothetical protein
MDIHIAILPGTHLLQRTITSQWQVLIGPLALTLNSNRTTCSNNKKAGIISGFLIIALSNNYLTGY